jgi:hypothetical protein
MSLDSKEYDRIWQAMRKESPTAVDQILKDLALDSAPMIDDTPVISLPTRALSLAVAGGLWRASQEDAPRGGHSGSGPLV